jgi:hypothetical protein
MKLSLLKLGNEKLFCNRKIKKINLSGTGRVLLEINISKLALRAHKRQIALPKLNHTFISSHTLLYNLSNSKLDLRRYTDINKESARQVISDRIPVL